MSERRTPRRPAPGLLAWLGAALTGVQVGAALVASRALVGELTPAALALLRYAIGLALIAPAWWWWRRSAPVLPMSARERARIAALGVLQFGLPIVMLNAALSRIDASLAALLFATFPLLTVLVAVALGHERLGWRMVLSAGLSVVGVAVALAGRIGWRDGAGTAEVVLGAALALGAALGCASCAVLYRPHLARHAALRIGVIAMAASVAALALPAGLEGVAAQLPALAPRGWTLVVFVGASSGAGYLLWLWVLARLPATRAAPFQALAPITAALLGQLLLGETVDAALALGLAGVAAGLWLATRGEAVAAADQR